MSEYGLWLSAAGMKVNQHRQTILANNMANANTTGFKRDLAIVTERQVESRESAGGLDFSHPILDELAGGLNVRPIYHDFAQGPIEWTGKPLDVAIEGDGFFSVSDGTLTRYSRAGEFAVNEAGELVLASDEGRWRVLDEGGSPIGLGDRGGKVSISPSGIIRQGKTVVAQLGLVTTEDKQSLRKVGKNLFKARDGDKMVPIAATLRPESREGSNFDIMKGLVEMIEAMRAYQLNAKMIQLQDKMTGQAVSTVGREA